MTERVRKDTFVWKEERDRLGGDRRGSGERVFGERRGLCGERSLASEAPKMESGSLESGLWRVRY